MTMLALRPNCECCDRDLPPSSHEARICTYECTFCAECADAVFKGACPNCGGNFAPRPVRPPHMLIKHPASAERYLGSEAACQQRRLAPA
jgi:hypothetical protein